MDNKKIFKKLILVIRININKDIVRMMFEENQNNEFGLIKKIFLKKILKI